MITTNTIKRSWDEAQLTEVLLHEMGELNNDGDVSIYHDKFGGVSIEINGQKDEVKIS